MKEILKFFSYLFLVITFQLNCEENLKFDVDYCSYKYDERTLLELYYSFYLSDLSLNKLDNQNFELAGRLEIEINNDDSLVLKKTYRVPLEIKDTINFKKEQKLLGQLNFLLSPSVYKIIIKAKDYYDTSKFTIKENIIDIKDYKTNDLTASDLQICVNIQKSGDSMSPFYKNGLEITPNPSRLFGNNVPDLFYYIEFYNLEKLNSSNYKVFYQISKEEQIISSFSRDYSLNRNSKAEFGSLDIMNFNTGKYKLQISVADISNTIKYQSANFFWVYNITSSDSQNIFDDTFSGEYSDMPEKFVNDEIEKIKYLMNDELSRKLSKFSTLEGKRIFLYGFWKIFDVTPNTPNNEFKNEYFARIEYSNKYFKEDFVDGWKTDRGRVFCVYGRPDEVERFPLEANTRAYEIWKYNSLEGGVEFVFMDITSGSGIYQLVHSTKKNELRDDEWRRRLNIRR
ncbi:MAG: GWxTD domain-containing protein [Chlorobi bacterium]|nr:GWxTD domain-containing protein [Chlorobiota bacterium]MCI0715001.1 GWxTD domain-containing protein [Chlorobiota bacterium]